MWQCFWKRSYFLCHLFSIDAKETIFEHLLLIALGGKTKKRIEFYSNKQSLLLEANYFGCKIDFNWAFLSKWFSQIGWLEDLYLIQPKGNWGRRLLSIPVRWVEEIKGRPCDVNNFELPSPLLGSLLHFKTFAIWRPVHFLSVDAFNSKQTNGILTKVDWIIEPHCSVMWRKRLSPSFLGTYVVYYNKCVVKMSRKKADRQ